MAQSLALFVKTIRKITRALQDIQKADIESTLPVEQPASHILPSSSGAADGGREIAKELQQEGDAVVKALKEQQREVIDSLDLKS